MDDKVALLEQEVVAGRDFQDTWDKMVEPFFEWKQKELYDAFLTVGVEDQLMLMNIKMQSMALDGLKSNFLHFINTGKLAEEQLRRNK